MGGDLTVGDHLLRFSNSSTRLIYKDNTVIDNNLLVLKNNTIITGAVNYFEINNSDPSGSNTSPSIVAKSSIFPDVGLKLETSGTGDIQINASLGNIYANSDSLVISGYVQNSIYRTSAKPGGYLPDTTWNVPFTSDTILFDFSNSTATGTYWANVGAGLDGQKLNIIYNNKSSNIVSVLVDFGSNGVIVGTGFVSGLNFTTVGQSSSLIYLADGVDAWQVLNTGSGVY